MKLLPLVLAISAVAFANIRTVEDRSEWLETLVKTDRQITENKFRANREYKFFYNGQLTSGIPGSSLQHSGTRIQSLVSIIFKSEDRVLLKLVETRFAKLNEEIPEPRRVMPFQAFEEIEMEPEMKNKLYKTVQFTYRNGLISNIEFDGEEQPWSANIKRGVLNMIQLNLNKESRIQREILSSSTEETDDLLSRTMKSFVVNEKTLEGECETLYTVVPKSESEMTVEEREMSDRVFKVVKSINFEKCINRPEIRYNERFQQICPTCESRYSKDERNLRSSSVMHMTVICPESINECLIKKTTAESEYTFVLFSEESNHITSFVRQTLELVETSHPETEVSEPRNKIRSDSEMIYSLDWDVMKEEFFLEGEDRFHKQTPFSKVEEKVQFVKSILEKLITYTRESVSEEAPRMVARLVRVLRMLKKDELKQVHRSFFENNPEGFTREEHKKIKDFLIDSLALAGTKDCIERLVSIIKKEEISEIKASMVIRKLMDVRVLNKDMIESVYSLCESSEMCERSEQIRQAVYLTVGSMVRTLCHDKEQDKPALISKFENMRTRMCPEEFRREFVEKLIRKFEKTESKYVKVLTLKTLANSGLKEILSVVPRIIKDKTIHPVVRTEAILTLKHLVDVEQTKIVKMLLPIYMTRSEVPSVRISAVYEILSTQPDKLVIDQIIRSLNSERHVQVASFTYSLLQTLSTSSNPCTQRLSNDIKVSLRYVRSFSLKQWMSNSRYSRVYETMSRHNNLGLSFDFFKIESPETLPRTFGAALNLNAASMWSPKFVSVQFGQLGLSRVLNQIWRSHSHNLQSSLSELVSGKFNMPSPKFNYRSELKEMFNKLNIEPEERSTFEPFGMLNLKFKDQEYAMLPFSSEIIPEELLRTLSSSDLSINRVVKMAKRLLKDTTVPFSFHTTTFVHEQSRKIPTSLGLPLRVSFKVPTVMQATGTVKIEFNSENPMKKMKVVVKDLKPSIVATAVTKIECWSPVVNSGVKVAAVAKLYTPLEASLSYDYTKSPVETKLVISPIVPETKEIVSLLTRPTTFTLTWPKSLRQWQEPEERTIHGVELPPMHTHDEILGENSLGVKFHSRARWFRNPKSTKTRSTPISLLSGPNMYILTLSPGHEMPKEFILSVTGKWFNEMKEKVVRTNFENFFEESSERSSQFLSSESSEEESLESNEYSRTYTGENPIKNEVTVLLTTKGSPVKREARVILSWFSDENTKTSKVRFTIDRTPIPNEENKPWKLVSELEMVHPDIPWTLNEISSDKRMMSRISTKWGTKGKLERNFNIKIVAEQSREMNELKSNSLYKRLYDNELHRSNFRSLFTPVAQYKHTSKFGLLDEIKIEMDYNMKSSQEDYLNSLFRMIKSNYYEQSTVLVSSGKKTTQGRVQVKLNVEPTSRRFVSMIVNTPFEETLIRDIPMSFEMPSWMNMRHTTTPSRSFYQLISRWFRSSSEMPVCESRTNLITTFEKREMEIPTSTCYTVLAKDCSSSKLNKFAVLVKKMSPTSERKSLKIVTENLKLVVRPTETEELECMINGERKECSELELETIHGNHVALQCRLIQTPSVIECHLPETGLKVFFDGFATDIKVSELYRSSVCGLCGEFDDEIETPIRRRLPEMRSTLESYLLRENESEQCEHEFSERMPLTKRMYNRQVSRSSSEEEDVFRSREELEILPEYLENPILERKSVVRPIEKTRLIEQGHEICFSKTPVMTCPRNTHSIKHNSEKQRVIFTCLSRNSIKSERLVREVLERGVVRSIESEPSSFTETIRVPVKCRHFD